MATVKVTRNGKPVSGARVETKATFTGCGKYDASGPTDGKGEISFENNANRFRIYVDGQEKRTVGSLSGTIEISL